MDEAQMKQLSKTMDTDGDGKIDFADFFAWYTRHSSATEDSTAAKIISLLRRCALRIRSQHATPPPPNPTLHIEHADRPLRIHAPSL